MIFRVDLRLRPEGRNGPICNALPAAERYYETFGRTWERQAWLRARPAAGDRALGDELLAALDPFIYPRSVEPRMVEEVRGLRALFRDPADASGALGDTGFDVKLGSGGIRDVEMVVQALQLLHAGKRPDLRERNTPRALPRLVVAGLLGDREAQTLLAGLSVLAAARASGAGGDRRPAPPAAGGRDEARGRLRAWAWASPIWPPSTPRWRRRARRSRRSPPRWVSRPPRRTWRRRACSIRCATATSWSDGSRRPDSTTSRSRPTRWSWTGARMPVAFLEEAIASPDPDRALAPLSRSGAAGLGRPDGAPARSPAAGADVGDAVRHQRLAGRAAGAPPRDVGAVPRRAGRARALARGALANAWPRWIAATNDARRGPDGDDDEETVLRRASGSSRRRRSCASACTTWPGSLQAAGGLARSSAIWPRSACAPGSRRRCRPSRRRLGSRGRRSPCSASAAWARARCVTGPIWIWSSSTAPPARATTGVDHREWFARASQRFIATMEAMLEEGRLYQVDTRLRPSGEQGLLVTSWASFERYHREEAAAWERVALLRARIVWTDEPAAARATRARALTSLAFDLPFDDESFRADLAPRAGAGGARAREGAGRLAPPAVRSGRNHGRRAAGRARPAAPRRRSRRSAPPRRRPCSTAGGARVARRAARRLRRRSAERRCGCGSCSTARRRSSRRAICRRWPAAWGPPPRCSPPSSTSGWRGSAPCSRKYF